MITPAYSPTATERVLPRLALDFTTGVLDSRVTVTRALNTATRVNSSGLIAGVNANLPRFDYDPVTLAPKGLLIEETRTNQLLYSQDFSNAAWLTGTSVIKTANAATGLDGTMSAGRYSKVLGQTTSSSLYNYPSGTLSAGAYTFSIYLKADGYDYVSIGAGSSYSPTGETRFNISNGTVVTGTGQITNAGNGWFRCVIFATYSSTVDNAIYIGARNQDGTLPVGNGVSGFYVWGGQFEAGAFATSYIPTTTTSLTRNADVVSMTGTNFSDWYNASEGSFLVVADSFANVTTAVAFRPFSVTSGSNGTLIGAYLYNGSWGASSLISFATQFDLSRAGLYTANTPVGIAIAYKLNDSAAAIAGTATLTDTSCNVPTVDRLTLGRLNGIDYLNGHVQKLSYWPQRLINNEARAFSK